MKRDTDAFLDAMRGSYKPDGPSTLEMQPGDHVAIAEIDSSIKAARVLRAWLTDDAYARSAFNIEWRKHHPKPEAES